MRSIQETNEEKETDTEITLGMRSLLGVFFGLVLICGVFFGFGYSLGRGSAPSPKPSLGATSESSAEKVPSKPLVQPPLTSSSREEDSPAAAPYTPGPDASEAEATPAPAPRKPSASIAKPVTQEPPDANSSAPAKHAPAIASSSAALPVTKASSAVTAAATEPVPASATPTAASTARTFATAAPPVPTMVQIAAVSRQEDADVLVAALKKRGYNVVVRNEPKDDLLHVQIGPFATRDEARATRAKLLADGYNAILK